MRKQLQKTVLLCMLLMAYIVQAQNLTVKVNTTTVSAQPSLQAAITASGVALGSITSLEVTAGDFTTADWNYLKNNRNSFASMTDFTITSGINTVANVPNTNVSTPYFKEDKMENVTVHKVNSIGEYMFAYVTSIRRVSFPDATIIRGNAFFSCRGLVEVNFPKITNIEGGLLGANPNLTRVSFPLVTSIGNFAFIDCSGLFDVSFPLVTSIGDSAFRNCTSLKGDSFPALTSIGNNAFENSGLTTASFPLVTTSIGDYAFADCNDLRSVSIPNARSIGNYAFADCNDLRSISIPNAGSIGANAFKNCTSLTTASFPLAISIGKRAFENCTSLTTASFPKSNLSIGDNAFTSCTSLAELALGAIPPRRVGSNAFSGTPNTRSLLFIDANNAPLTGTTLANVQRDYDRDEGSTTNNRWYGWKTDTPAPAVLKVTVNRTAPEKVGRSLAIALSSTNLSTITSLVVTEGTFTTADWEYLKANRNNLTAMTYLYITNSITAVDDIPNTTSDNPYFNPDKMEGIIVNKVENIGNYAFKGCNRLTTASFPKVTRIGDHAFDGCSRLTTALFPVAESIGNYAFYFSYDLTTASFPKVTRIGDSAFEHCTSLTMVSFPVAESIGDHAFGVCRRLTTASFPVATSIGDTAFGDCISLITASFPVATSIGDRAFGTCSNLTELVLGATPPTVTTTDVFDATPSTRSLVFIDTNNTLLTGGGLTNAQNAYKAVADGNTTDNLWYGWETTNATPAVLKVTVNGATPQKVGVSLEAALSGVDISTITSLEVTSGTFTVNDWNYLKSKRSNLTAMTSFTITNSITAVANIPDSNPGSSRASYFNNIIETVTVNKLAEIGDLAFRNCIGLKSVSFPDATRIRYAVFSGCTSLKSVSLPKITALSNYAFSGCTNLTTASLPAVTIIGNSSFKGCTSLTNVSFSEVTVTGADAFKGCTSLTTVSLPKLGYIYPKVFENCTSLNQLAIGATPPVVANSNAFSGTSTPRSLLFVDANNAPLTGTALTNARNAYKAVNDGNATDNLWYGWRTNTAVYTLTTTATNGTITATQQYAEAGKTIGFTLSPNAGYQLKANGLKVYQTGTPATTVAVTSNSFTMPAYNVTISAEFLKATTINFVDISKTYGDASFTLNATSDSAGAISYSIVSGTGVSLSGANNSTVNITGAGVVTIRATQLETATHAQATKDITLTIAKKELTVTAADKTKAYNNAVFPVTDYSVNYTGFANSDTASVLGGSLAYGGTSKTAKNVGTYTIVPSGLTSNNYTMNYVAGSLEITKATLTGITFSDATFAYDGTEKSLAITGDLPTGTSVSYTGNNQTDVGVYTVTANIAGGTNYNNASLTANLTVTKATLTGITLSDATFEYDGTEKSLAIVGNLPAGVSVSYTNNANTSAGTYQVTANIAGGTNYKDTSLTANLTITKAPLTGITFSDATFAYDGTEKSLAIVGNLPTGASVNYTNNANTDAGAYTVIANINGGTNYNNTTLTATLTIESSKADITGITFSDNTVTYNGNKQSLAITGNLPAGTSVSYTNNANINAGTYEVVATINGGDDYKNLTLTATITIKKATITGITFSDKTVAYDGALQSLAIVGDLPTGTLVNYINNANTKEGVYTITANIDGGKNYNDTTLTAVLTIASPKEEIIGITFSDKTVTYNGSLQSLAIAGNLPTGTSVSYTGNANINAGIYNVVATIKGGTNYKDATLTATITIEKAAQTITWENSTTNECEKITLKAVSSSGLPVSFESSNANVDIQGNVLTVLNTEDSSVIVEATQSGNSNYLPADSVEKSFFIASNSLIKKLSPTVLGFDNSSELYSNWQWYKNGTKITGATKQFYNEKGALSGSFYVAYQDKKGTNYQTCPLAVNASDSKYGLRLYPNPVNRSTTYSLKNFYSTNTLVGAKIQVFNLLGQKVKEVNNVGQETSLEAPNASGIYIIILQLANGVRETINLSVK